MKTSLLCSGDLQNKFDTKRVSKDSWNKRIWANEDSAEEKIKFFETKVSSDLQKVLQDSKNWKDGLSEGQQATIGSVNRILDGSIRSKARKLVARVSTVQRRA